MGDVIQNIQFGSGVLLASRLTGDVTTTTPVQFGVLQEINLEVSFSEKTLHGMYQFPIDVARAGAKITGKAKMANLDGVLFNELFFGQSIASGNVLPVLNEVKSIPDTPGPYTFTPDRVTEQTPYAGDLGVRDVLTGKKFRQVYSPATPTAGQYIKTSAGLYTFAAADKLKSVQVSYNITVGTGGNIITVTNQLMGAGPRFQVVLARSFRGKNFNVILYTCSSSKLSLPTKNEDYTVAEFDFGVMDDGSGNICTFSFPNDINA